MTSSEWVRATNALTALEQCGNALAKGIQDQLAALTMAQAVMERTRAWLRDAEPQPGADESFQCPVCAQRIPRPQFAAHIHGHEPKADRPPTAAPQPAHEPLTPYAQPFQREAER